MAGDGTGRLRAHRADGVGLPIRGTLRFVLDVFSGAEEIGIQRNIFLGGLVMFDPPSVLGALDLLQVRDALVFSRVSPIPQVIGKGDGSHEGENSDNDQNFDHGQAVATGAVNFHKSCRLGICGSV